MMTAQLNTSVGAQSGVTVSTLEINGKNAIKFVFQGQFTAKSAASAIDQWKKVIQKLESGTKVMCIWECHAMTGYEPDARFAWQKAMKECQGNTESIWVVTKSKLIKAGAMILVAFTNHPIKVVSSESEII